MKLYLQIIRTVLIVLIVLIVLSSPYRIICGVLKPHVQALFSNKAMKTEIITRKILLLQFQYISLCSKKTMVIFQIANGCSFKVKAASSKLCYQGNNISLRQNSDNKVFDVSNYFACINRII